MRIYFFTIIAFLAMFSVSSFAKTLDSSSDFGLNVDNSPLMMSAVDDDQNLWPFEPDEWAEEEEEPSQDEEEVVEPQPDEEEEANNEEEEQPVEDVNEEDTESGLPRIPESALSNSDWDSVKGMKVPFFFLVDSDTIDALPDISVAEIKALKFGGQILNGIPFVYNATTGEVYLTENVGSLPENIMMINETFYSGVVRYDFEVAQPDDEYNQMRVGRRVVVESEKDGSSIATAFESCRTDVFQKAVKSAAQHMRPRFKKDENQVSGKIRAWEVLNEGYVSENESFYIQLRAWVTFDGYED